MKSDKDSPGGSAYTVEHQVGYMLRRAHQRATALFQANIGDPGTTPTQFTSMVKLGEHGELSQNLLGRMVGLDKATTQGVVRRLRDRALIAARPDPTDARRTLLRLTPEGEQMLARLVANGPRVTAETLKPLDAAEQRTLLDLLSRLT
ncbi:MAG: MarR family transcriptional regulator [Alphaproteobacteria bacterium]|nr:MarR family transcriptional regulator [Alphaproteobacteria bacterium]